MNDIYRNHLEPNEPQRPAPEQCESGMAIQGELHATADGRVLIDDEPAGLRIARKVLNGRKEFRGMIDIEIVEREPK